MLAVLAALAFVVGFSVHRGTNCSVVAAHQLARRRDPTRLASFIAGACAAMMIAAPVAWSDPATFKIAASHGITWAAVIGGAFYGVGALVNGACAWGTVVRISEGRLAFLATIPGVGLGAYLAIRWDLAAYRGDPVPALMAAPTALGSAALISAAVIALAALISTLYRIGRAGLRPVALIRASRWRPVMAMLATGLAGGLAFIIADGWTWPSLVRRVSQALAGGVSEFPLAMLVGPLALFVGGFSAAFLSGRFELRVGGWEQPVRSLAGGTIMGSSAALVPGGNDVMLLHALPSMALSGIVAYVAMLGVLVLTFKLFQRWRVVPDP